MRCLRQSGSCWRNPAEHPPHVASITNATNQEEGRDLEPIAEVAQTCILEKQANCLETRNAFNFGIIWRRCCIRNRTWPNRSVFGAGLAVPMWKLWPLSSKDKRCDGYFKITKSLLVLEIVPLPNKRWFAWGPSTNIT
jgi:hypothetical protein